MKRLFISTSKRELEIATADHPETIRALEELKTNIERAIDNFASSFITAADELGVEIREDESPVTPNPEKRNRA